MPMVGTFDMYGYALRWDAKCFLHALKNLATPLLWAAAAVPRPSGWPIGLAAAATG